MDDEDLKTGFGSVYVRYRPDDIYTPIHVPPSSIPYLLFPPFLRYGQVFLHISTIENNPPPYLIASHAVFLPLTTSNPSFSPSPLVCSIHTLTVFYRFDGTGVRGRIWNIWFMIMGNWSELDACRDFNALLNGSVIKSGRFLSRRLAYTWAGVHNRGRNSLLYWALGT